MEIEMQNGETKQLSSGLFGRKFNDEDAGPQPLGLLNSGGKKAVDPFERYGEIWLVHFVFDRLSGERPIPSGLIARECRSGRLLRLRRGSLSPGRPPFPLGPGALYVTYDAPAALGCHLVLGWAMPANILDLHAEFRCLTSGQLDPGDYSLTDALTRLGLAGTGVEGLKRLLDAMRPQLDLQSALLRGRYTAAVARMEAVGVPIDMERFNRLRGGWERIQDTLIERVDHNYGVYRGRKLQPYRWAAWLNRSGIAWPRRNRGKLDLSLEAFRDMAHIYPCIRPVKELQATLARLRWLQLAVGKDSRNRCPLRPFASKTGRNQPSSTKFVFGSATWIRGLIQPQEGMALAYIDYAQQEFGIAAALSRDPAMMEAYRSGDPFLTFAKQAGAVPNDATKETHREERERFKRCALGIQYGMQERSLAIRLGVTSIEARRFLKLHRETYPVYWEWSNKVKGKAKKNGNLKAEFGWMLQVEPKAKSRSVKNWPLQANGAEMLRLACIALTEAGVRVCAPVHDAVLVEASAADIEQVVDICQQAMQKASEVVLSGFPLRAEAKVVWYPDRYMDPRGLDMWEMVFNLLD
jgi:hypothetical protein